VARSAPTSAEPAPTHISAPPDIVRLPEKASSGPIEPSAQRHVARGRDFAARLWCHDAFGEFERAIALDPSVRSDARVTNDPLRGLGESIGARPPGGCFLAEKMGPPANGPLRKLLADARISPEVRRAAEGALQGLKD